MELNEIRSQLTHYTGTFPEKAVRAAIEQPELNIPYLLASLEEVANEPKKLSDPDFMLPMYAFYLLAQFREERAYPLLIKLFSSPGDFVLDATGDFVTEDFGRVLASVCGDDIVPIKKMIEDTSLNEFVRSAALTAITILVAENKIEREEAIAYFTSLFRGTLKKECNLVWSSLISSCCDLGPDELIFDIKQSFSEGLVDSMFIDFECVKRLVNKTPRYILYEGRKYRFIGNVVDEMSWWAAFNKKESASKPKKISNITPKDMKIGRNAPCPCGSGKKYKKCCSGSI